MASPKEYFERHSRYSTALDAVKQKHLDTLKTLAESNERREQAIVAEWHAVMQLRVLIATHNTCYNLLERLNEIDDKLLNSLIVAAGTPLELIEATYAFVVSPVNRSQFNALEKRQHLFRNIFGFAAVCSFIGGTIGLIGLVSLLNPPLFFLGLAAFGLVAGLYLLFKSGNFARLPWLLAHTTEISETLEFQEPNGMRSKDTRSNLVSIDYSHATNFFANKDAALFREVQEAFINPIHSM